MSGKSMVLPKARVAAPKSRVRDRIFKTACGLFYRHGIRGVGVDMIASEAGTNKMSFYRAFHSKDELVAEYLRDQEREGWAWWDSIIAPHAGDPRAQVEALFDSHVARTCQKSSRGCAMANAAAEISDPDHPARVVVEQFKRELRRRFRQLAVDVGAHEAEALGDALMLLFEGSLLTRLTFDSQQGPARNAGAAARALMRAYTS
jgi:AcrR family transcriptional regulator